MKIYSTKDIRNVILVSHGGAGKTTFIESIAFKSGKIDRMGKVTDGNTISDFEHEEIKKGISIYLSVIPIEWKNKKINILDTPGYLDFIAEVKCGLRVVENALVFIDAIAGIQVGTERVVSYLEDYNLSYGFIVNKMDRENVNFEEIYDSIRNQFGAKCVAVQIPYMNNNVFTGIIDIIEKKLIKSDNKIEDIPQELLSDVNQYYDALLENSVEANDSILEKYLSGETITKEELIACIKEAITKRKIIPIMVCSGLNSIGTNTIADFIADYFTSPEDKGPFKAMNIENNKEILLKPSVDEQLGFIVFKTSTDPYVGQLSLVRVFSGSIKPDSKLYNISKNEEEKITQTSVVFGKNQVITDCIPAGDIGVLTKLLYTKTSDSFCDVAKKIKLDWIDIPKPNMRMAILAKTKNDEDKLGTVLPKIQDEDLTIKIIKDDEIKQTIIYGIGDTHLQTVVEKIKRKFGVNVELINPKIPYKETIKKTVKVEAKYKKQTGGHGQYGHCWLEVSPLPRGGNFEFESKIFGGAIPKQYIPAIEKGIVESLPEGILAGYPVVDIKVVVIDGSYHPVDSSEMAFKIAGSMGFKKGLQEGEATLLEPIMNVKITVPERYMGTIIEDLNSKRGKVLNVDSEGSNRVITAEVPMVEMQRYNADLSSLSGARGFFDANFSHYEEANPKIVKLVTEQAKNE